MARGCNTLGQQSWGNVVMVSGRSAAQIRGMCKITAEWKVSRIRGNSARGYDGPALQIWVIVSRLECAEGTQAARQSRRQLGAGQGPAQEFGNSGVRQRVHADIDRGGRGLKGAGNECRFQQAKAEEDDKHVRHDRGKLPSRAHARTGGKTLESPKPSSTSWTSCGAVPSLIKSA